MKIIGALSVIFICFFLNGAAVSAHQPRLVDGGGPLEIKKPETSQAFYAELEGQKDLYYIDTAGDLALFVGLLVPDQPDVRTDITAAVFSDTAGSDEKLLFTLDGEAYHWEKHFEPFAGDRYLKGPETEKKVPGGRYRIEVSNPDNRGRYVLVVGREEKFSLAETVEMITVLPSLKKDFFGKSPLTAYFNLVGLFMLSLLLLPVSACFAVYQLVHKRKARSGR